jgi:hypothetical protein
MGSMCCHAAPVKMKVYIGMLLVFVPFNSYFIPYINPPMFTAFLMQEIAGIYA